MMNGGLISPIRKRKCFLALVLRAGLPYARKMVNVGPQAMKPRVNQQYRSDSVFLTGI